MKQKKEINKDKSLETQLISYNEPSNWFARKNNLKDFTKHRVLIKKKGKKRFIKVA